MPGWISPDSHVAGVWANEANAYDEGDVSSPSSYTSRSKSCSGNIWTEFLELTFSTPRLCSKVKVWAKTQYTSNDLLDVDAYYRDAWNHVIDASTFQSMWKIGSFGGSYLVEKIRIRLRVYRGSCSSRWHRVYEAMCYEEDPVAPGYGDCIAMYRMNDDAPNTIVKDESNNRIDGVAPRNTNLMHVVDGRIDGALHHNGSEVTSVPDDPVHDPGGAMTILFWFRTSVAGQTRLGFLTHDLSDMKYRVSCGMGMQLGEIDGIIGTPSGYITLVANSGIVDYWADGVWHLVVVSFDRSLPSARAKIYVDNELYQAHDGYDDDITAGDEGLTIGYGDSGNIEADIDFFAMFNRELTESELTYIWNGGNGTERLGPCHNVYRGQDGNMDYANSVAIMDIEDSQVSIVNQALPPNTIWEYLRRQVSECGLESGDSPACKVAIDSAGDMIGDTPNPPLSLTIQGLSNGRFKLRWHYTTIGEEIAPTGFNIYMDSGSGFDFETPTATVSYGLGGRGEFEWISDPLTDGEPYRFCVRSYQSGPPVTESQNTDFVANVADSVGPDAITGLRASYKVI